MEQMRVTDDSRRNLSYFLDCSNVHTLLFPTKDQIASAKESYALILDDKKVGKLKETRKEKYIYLK